MNKMTSSKPFTGKSVSNLSLFMVLAFFVQLILLSSCDKKVPKSFTFAFYNVENLFDTIDDPSINDSSFLPGSKVAWNTERYQHKLDNLTKVMSSVDSGSYPALFGLCEIENLDVLKDLINHPGLSGAGYAILHKNSPDERGIDVALLYQPGIYTPVKTKYLKMDFPSDPENKTRDILYSKGLINNSDTLHVFINHWVSRWGGQEETEPLRRFIGNYLKKVTDSIFKVQPNANIIIAGDLNDNPDNLSVMVDLNAKVPEEKLKNATLYNTSFSKFKNGEGTLYYKSWDMFDQIILSNALLTGENGIRANSVDQEIVKHDWMLYEPKNGPKRPNRTAAGKYFGGYSDHLPVFIQMTY